jgi:hypothetical protein
MQRFRYIYLNHIGQNQLPVLWKYFCPMWNNTVDTDRVGKRIFTRSAPPN